MKDSSLITLRSSLKEALSHYQSNADTPALTDIHLQPDRETGELTIFNDDDEILATTIVEEWAYYHGRDFYGNVEQTLKTILKNLDKELPFSKLALVKPFSFVLVDDDRETVAELMLVDDEGTMFLDDELLKGLDQELDAFLKDLMK